MRLSIWLKAAAPIELVKQIAKDQYEVWVRQPSHEGRADRAILRVLAEHFRISQSRIRIIDHASRPKIIEI